MRDNVAYSMSTFDIIEELVSAAKRDGYSYDYTLQRVIDVALQRQEIWHMAPSMHEYDSANIMATFNIIWGE